MGWSVHNNTTMKQMIKYLTDTQGYRNGEGECVTLAKCLRGFTLWAIHEVRWKCGTRPPMRFIACYLLRRYGSSGEVGYKSMDESCGPGEYNCPLAYLDRVPECNPDWRVSVRQYHARHNRTLKLEEVVTLQKGCSPSRLIVKNLRPLTGKDPDSGTLFRFKRTQLADPTSQPATANSVLTESQPLLMSLF